MKTIGDIAALNNHLGMNWFSPETLKYWNTKFYNPTSKRFYIRAGNWKAIQLIDGKYFIHRSEFFSHSEYALVECLSGGRVKTLCHDVDFNEVKDELQKRSEAFYKHIQFSDSLVDSRSIIEE
jgi:hypothetical protein